MANYTPPVYNTPINIWHDGTATTDPPDVEATVNFAWDRRGHTDSIDPGAPENTIPFMTVLAPSDTDIRGYVNTGGSPDVIEVPAGSGRYYLVHYVDFIGMGFPNEHLGCDVYMNIGSAPPPGGSHILTEGSDIITTEGGDEFIVE